MFNILIGFLFTIISMLVFVRIAVVGIGIVDNIMEEIYFRKLQKLEKQEKEKKNPLE